MAQAEERRAGATEVSTKSAARGGIDSQRAALIAGAVGATERNHEVGPRIGRAIVGLPIQVFVLEEEYRVVAANGGTQQAVGIERV